MDKFICGFVSGVILKNKLINILTCRFVNTVKLYHNFNNTKKIKNDSEMFVICKISNKDLFDELFPKLNTKYRTQPMWDYNENKKIIKIKVDTVLIDKEIHFKDFLYATGLDIPFFETFSELYVYIHYTINNNKYINFYTSDNIINPEDFVIQETELSKKYNNLICVTLTSKEKPIYITKYFKKYLNNKNKITLENLLLNCDTVDKSNVNLIVVNSKIINTFSLTETI